MNNTNRTYLPEIQNGVSINSFNDEFNPEQTRTNPFNPYRYDQVADWIERLSPDAINRLGWDSDDDLLHMVNQEFMLTERPFASDEDL